MSSKYVIKWRSKVNGRAGKGTKEFEREDAERLVAELNDEYPDIEHDILETPSGRAGDESTPASNDDAETPVRTPDIHVFSAG
jgi:hypothetical protein